eukprot:7389141-Prymnesium_polylepis.1
MGAKAMASMYIRLGSWRQWQYHKQSRMPLGSSAAPVVPASWQKRSLRTRIRQQRRFPLPASGQAPPLPPRDWHSSW